MSVAILLSLLEVVSVSSFKSAVDWVGEESSPSSFLLLTLEILLRIVPLKERVEPTVSDFEIGRVPASLMEEEEMLLDEDSPDLVLEFD